MKTHYRIYYLVFAICLFVFIYTAAPTILVTDSPELVAAAVSLGIPHAPGYPLYTLTAHLINQLPYIDPAYALNLYSAVSLALAAPLLMLIVQAFVRDHLVSASVTLTVMFSYYIWTTGIVAEVYAQQLLTLSATGASLVLVSRQAELRIWHSAFVGVVFGLAVAMAPSSILLAAGLVLAFLLLKIPRLHQILSGIISLLVFGSCLLYFPLAYQTDPEINAAGVYDESGEFQTVDLTTVDGVWWLLSGAQFDDEFFEDGLVATPERIMETARWLVTNLYAIGFFVAVIGGYMLYQKSRGALAVWLTLFVPYTYFFMNYGADDRETMFGPSILLLTVLFGIGMEWLVNEFSRKTRVQVLVFLPALFFALNFGVVNSNGTTNLHEHVEIVAMEIPPDAVVFGDWADAMPLTYLQLVEDQRPDVEIYTLFFFEYDQQRIQTFIDSLLENGSTVVFLDNAAEENLDFTHYRFQEIYAQATGPHNRPIRLVKVESGG